MKIGKIDIEQPLFLAPMDSIANTSFRVMFRRLGADIVFTEFTSSEALIRQAAKAIRKIKICAEERPIAIQIFGSVEQSMEKAAQIAEQYQPDFIDINCGCWTKNHAHRGECSGLLRDLKRLESVIRATVQSTRLPVTVKTRLGWDEKSIVILDAAKIIEQSGAQALTVHCRTRMQGYKGQADWSWLEKIKKIVSIPVVGNGDVLGPQDVKMMRECGCDGVMIGRGAIANPWIFRQAKFFLQTGQFLPEPSLSERVERCIEHLKLSVEHAGLRNGILTFRKYYSGYLKGLPHVAKLRSELFEMLELEPIISRLYEFLEQCARERQAEQSATLLLE
ncbi:MAG: tRNA dihydrouridine synthase DusB [Candidatus Omnitrophota bacterium]